MSVVYRIPPAVTKRVALRDGWLPGGWSQDDHVKDGVGAILQMPGWPSSARPEDLHAPFSVDVTKVIDSTVPRMLHMASLDQRVVYIGVLPSRSPAVGSSPQFAARPSLISLCGPGAGSRVLTARAAATQAPSRAACATAWEGRQGAATRCRARGCMRMTRS